MKTILLIDDDLVVQQTVSDYLTMKTSCKVVTAVDRPVWWKVLITVVF